MISEQTAKRLANQQAVLRALHFHGPLHRAELSRELHIRKSSITGIVSDLLEAGIVREESPGKSRTAVHLDTSIYHALVAGITPRRIHFARVYLDGRIEESSESPLSADTGPNAVIDLVVRGFCHLLDTQRGEPMGLGISVPGLVDARQGLCVRAANLHEWHDVLLGLKLATRLGTPVSVDNDVRCQLRACTWFDKIVKDAENVIYLHLHEGIAAGIMTHGQLIAGEHLAAGEIGHVRIGDEGRLCTCGRTDCLETYCSLPAIIREISLVQLDLNPKTASDVAQAAANEPAIINILDRMALRLARALAGLVAAIDPHTLVLGTADKEFSELLKPMLQRHLYNELIGLQASDAAIRIIDDVDILSLRGAAVMVTEQAFETGMFSFSANG